jgi:hypothetical protein
MATLVAVRNFDGVLRLVQLPGSLGCLAAFRLGHLLGTRFPSPEVTFHGGGTRLFPPNQLSASCITARLKANRLASVRHGGSLPRESPCLEEPIAISHHRRPVKRTKPVNHPFSLSGMTEKALGKTLLENSYGLDHASPDPVAN